MRSSINDHAHHPARLPGRSGPAGGHQRPAISARAICRRPSPGDGVPVDPGGPRLPAAAVRCGSMLQSPAQSPAPIARPTSRTARPKRAGGAGPPGRVPAAGPDGRASSRHRPCAPATACGWPWSARTRTRSEPAYGANQSITANCSTICSIPGFSHESLETLTRWGGERVQVTASKQRQVGVFRSPSLGEMEGRVSVLNPRELLRRGQEEVLVFTAGCAPTWLRKVRYDQEREFRRMFDPPDCLAIAGRPGPQPLPPEDPSGSDFDRIPGAPAMSDEPARPAGHVLAGRAPGPDRCRRRHAAEDWLRHVVLRIAGQADGLDEPEELQATPAPPAPAPAAGNPPPTAPERA